MKRTLAVAALSVASIIPAAPAKAHFYKGCKKNPCKKHVVKPHQSWLHSTGNCETRGYGLWASLRAHSPTGQYHGRFQFDLSSWRGAGGRGDPHNGGLLEQRFRAVVWLHLAGRNAWPNCG